MSRVYVLAADKELPLCDFWEPRTAQSGGYTVTFDGGFRVAELDCYRQAVDGLNCPMKPFRYEFTLEKEEIDLNNMRAYLGENFSAGESLELWSVWVEDGIKRTPPRFRGRLADFDMETLEQFLTAEELCFTVEI